MEKKILLNIVQIDVIGIQEKANLFWQIRLVKKMEIGIPINKVERILLKI